MHLLNLRFGSNDLDKARAFYDATFAALGLAPAPMREDKRLIYKLPGGPSFAIAPPRDGCAATHANGGTIVFEADSDDQVFAWYEAGLANGGTCEGKAEPKPQAGGKIGAYLRDPDGNKLGCYHGVSAGCMARAVSVSPDGRRSPVSREWVPEVPVALEFNGLSYAVMMATPADLADFALGFALSERLAQRASDLTDLAIAEVEHGWIVRGTLSGVGLEQLTERVRARVAESSCGLCGVENLAAIAQPLPTVAAHRPLEVASIFAGLADLKGRQPLGTATGAAHAACWADPSGAIGWVREDVGRHNAMDKLIGAMAWADAPLSPGFILSTARCSYEIVEKAVRAGATSLVTVSLPTSMAVTRAKAAGLSLWSLAREDSVLLVTE